MKTLVLVRSPSSDQGTLGEFWYKGQKICSTIELPDHGNQANISRIPHGEYTVVRRKSPKFGWTYHLADVPRRSWILIHGGNLAGDKSKGYLSHSAGCILVGTRSGTFRKQKAVFNSKSALQKLYSVMGEAAFKLVIVGWH